MIAGSCPALAPGQGFLAGLLDYIDCQTAALGGGGWQSLTAPSSTLSVLVTGLLTLFVALLGYRMVFGQTPSVRDGVLTFIKIGIVLTFAMSWPAYRTLVHDVALQAPAELAAEIGRPAGLPGAAGGLVARLDGADTALVTLLAIEQAPPDGATPPNLAAATAFVPSALGAARVTYLAATFAALAAVRLVAGLLLALGPFFIAFLLFDGTRGLFEGWLRSLAGAALGALGSAIVLGVQLALLEPRLADAIARRSSGEPMPGLGVETFVICLCFALALLAVLLAAARVALGFRLPWSGGSRVAGDALLVRPEPRMILATGEVAVVRVEDRPRALAVADAVAATQRREVAILQAARAPGAAGTGISATIPLTDTAMPPPPPLGQSFRRARGRNSGASGRRDAR